MLIVASVATGVRDKGLPQWHWRGQSQLNNFHGEFGAKLQNSQMRKAAETAEDVAQWVPPWMSRFLSQQTFATFPQKLGASRHFSFEQAAPRDLGTDPLLTGLDLRIGEKGAVQL